MNPTGESVKDEKFKELVTGDLVKHFTHPGEIGEIVETIPVRTGGKVHHVVWPGSDIAIPYFSYGALKKVDASKVHLTTTEGDME